MFTGCVETVRSRGHPCLPYKWLFPSLSLWPKIDSCESLRKDLLPLYQWHNPFLWPSTSLDCELLVEIFLQFSCQYVLKYRIQAQWQPRQQVRLGTSSWKGLALLKKVRQAGQGLKCSKKWEYTKGKRQNLKLYRPPQPNPFCQGIRSTAEYPEHPSRYRSPQAPGRDCIEAGQSELPSHLSFPAI